MKKEILSVFLCLFVFQCATAWWSEEVDEYEDVDLDESFGVDPGDNVIVTVFRDSAVGPDDNSFIPKEVPIQPDRIDPPSIPRGELDITVEKLAEKLDGLVSEMKAQQDKITELENANKKLLEKIDSIEQQTKTNSVIFSNVPETKRETYKSTLQKVLHVTNRLMKVKTSADDIAVALRAESNTSKDRPIVVRFTNFATKMKVLGARNRLSHTKIIVSGDYSEQVARKRGELVPYMMRARNEGHNAYILYDKLVVDNVVKTLEELQAEEKQAETPCQTEETPDQDVEEVEVPPEVQDPELEEVTINADGAISY